MHEYTRQRSTERIILIAAIVIGSILAFGIASPAAPYVPTKPHSSGAIVATEGPGAEACFPAKVWNRGVVAEEKRPCDVLYRPQEDGSGTLVLGSEVADYAVCTIPNPREEHGHFTIRCHRVNGGH